jgi:hypothetical protein
MLILQKLSMLAASTACLCGSRLLHLSFALCIFEPATEQNRLKRPFQEALAVSLPPPETGLLRHTRLPV